MSRVKPRLQGNENELLMMRASIMILREKSSYPKPQARGANSLKHLPQLQSTSNEHLRNSLPLRKGVSLSKNPSSSPPWALASSRLNIPLRHLSKLRAIACMSPLFLMPSLAGPMNSPRYMPILRLPSLPAQAPAYTYLERQAQGRRPRFVKSLHSSMHLCWLKSLMTLYL